MIPIQLLMIPTYLMFARLGIVDTLAAAFVPWLASAFGIFLMRQFFLSLPVELEEAARIDGCSAVADVPAASCCRWPGRRWPRWPSSRCCRAGTTCSGR